MFSSSMVSIFVLRPPMAQEVVSLNTWKITYQSYGEYLVPVKARLARDSTLTIGQSASEPEPHRIRSTSLAIGADDLDARGRSPNVPSKDPAIVRRRSRGSLPRLHLSRP